MADPIQGGLTVGSLYPQRPMGGAASVGAASDAPATSFKDTLSKALGDVQDVQDGASDAVQAFLRGDPVELHDVMAAVEEAGIALDMLIEVRNQFVDAYRTVVNMQG